MDPLKQRFIELWKASKWSQAELGRRMDMTRGGINGIITGDTIPDKRTVKYLAMLVAESGVVISPGEPSANSELTKKLNEIHEHDPKLFKAAKTMIESLHEQIPAPKKKISSSPASTSSIDPKKVPLPAWIERGDAQARKEAADRVEEQKTGGQSLPVDRALGHGQTSEKKR